MTGKVQHLTRSQFILIYGPGAIIESEGGPRLIPSINKGVSTRYLNSSNIRDFEIVDSRLRVVLKNLKGKDAGVFALPTNAGLNIPSYKAIYSTYYFPRWRICYGRKANHDPILYGTTGCPICNKDYDSSAVRFVMACINGHMDEVRWSYAVHSKKGGKCEQSYFNWDSHGSSLADITISCPKCGASTNMEEIYNIDFKPCSARLPETELPSNKTDDRPSITSVERNSGKCNKIMKTLQRQSSALRVADTVTFLTIPEYDKSISNVLQRAEVSSAIEALIVTGSALSDQDFLAALDLLMHISTEAKETIKDYVNKNSKLDLITYFNKLNDKDRKFMDFIYEEFESLASGAPRCTDNFSILEPIHVKSYTFPFLVYPIDRLRTVTAQIGYTRTPYTENNNKAIIDSSNRQVSCQIEMGGMSWYPGFEGKGEGLFITLEDDFNESFFNKDNSWEIESDNNSGITFGNQYWENVPARPMFVWYHSISHALIRALSQYGGYSSSSLRERVYVDRKFKKGGILIYTTSPGDDGSMGGLIGIANQIQLEEIIEQAITNLRFCSNDPLCFETKKVANKVNGAACYSCLFTSETSCEHRNMCLDRHIVIGD